MTSLPSRLVVVFACISLGSSQEQRSELEHKNTNFDIYIFTLHWPYTTCLDWSKRGHDRDEWSVHGVWPTRFGEINPNFCNSSWTYNHDQMKDIMGEMSRYWPDVEMRHVVDSLWDHEWTKHGTCAVASAKETHITNQTEYFRTGCKLARENPVTDWLARAGVKPNNNAQYETRQVWDAVMAGSGDKRPHIDCTEVQGQALISEIKLCYDKNLTRVHCDGIVGGVSMAGKCLRYSNFLYPASLSLPLRAPLTSGQVAGIVCTVLALAALALSVGYWCYKRSNRGRGYESL